LAVALDHVDRRILTELRRDGRISVRDLAGRCQISRANAYARLSRLHRDGVISGYTAVVNPERAGYGQSAYVNVKIQQRSWRSFRDKVAAVPGVEHVTLVSGEYDIVLLVRAVDVKELRDVILERLQDMPEVLATQMNFILDEMPGAGHEPPN
jgi:DNA-binding Lrp family transcriptional regulator